MVETVVTVGEGVLVCKDVRACVRAGVRACGRACVRACGRACGRAGVRACVRAGLCECVCACACVFDVTHVRYSKSLQYKLNLWM